MNQSLDPQSKIPGYSSLRTADVSPRSSPLRDVSRGGSLSGDERGETSAVRRLSILPCSEITSYCRLKLKTHVSKIEHEWNGHLEIFSLPQAIENSREFWLLRTDIIQKTVVACPLFFRKF